MSKRFTKRSNNTKALTRDRGIRVSQAQVIERRAALPWDEEEAASDNYTIQPPHKIKLTRFPLVTVAVCTRDRHKSLERCLNSLAQLKYPRLEVVVVDNASKTDQTRSVVEQYPQFRYVLEARPGLDWARNRAISEAKGDIIAFTDDDVVVDAYWLIALVHTFQVCNADCVTGNVLPYQIETEAQWLFEQYGGFSRGYHRRICTKETPLGISYPVAAHHFGTGANMAFRSALFKKIGKFDEALDVGTASGGAGDLEIFFRVVKSGHRLVFEPNALVWHVHRRDYKALHRQLQGNGISYYAYLSAVFMQYPDERVRVVRFALWWWLYWNVFRLAREIYRPTGFPISLITAEMFGAFSGPFAYLRARKQAQVVAKGNYKSPSLSAWLEGESA